MHAKQSPRPVARLVKKAACGLSKHLSGARGADVVRRRDCRAIRVPLSRTARDVRLRLPNSKSLTRTQVPAQVAPPLCAEGKTCVSCRLTIASPGNRQTAHATETASHTNHHRRVHRHCQASRRHSIPIAGSTGGSVHQGCRPCASGRAPVRPADSTLPTTLYIMTHLILII